MLLLAIAGLAAVACRDAPPPAAALPDAVPALSALAEGEPPIEGAQCDLYHGGELILRSDWVSSAWVRLDGKPVEFKGARTAEAGVRDLAERRWRQAFAADDATIHLDLVRVREGDGDGGVELQGTVGVRRGSRAVELPVTGGCGS